MDTDFSSKDLEDSHLAVLERKAGGAKAWFSLAPPPCTGLGRGLPPTCSGPTWLRGCASSLHRHGGCWGSRDPALGTSLLRLLCGERPTGPTACPEQGRGGGWDEEQALGFGIQGLVEELPGCRPEESEKG